VGFDDRDVQVGSTAMVRKAVLKYCNWIVTTWLSVLRSKDTLPLGDLLVVKVVGEHASPGI
jgi:hypothetical protein